MSLKGGVRLLFSITIIYGNCIAMYFPFLDLYNLAYISLYLVHVLYFYIYIYRLKSFFSLKAPNRFVYSFFKSIFTAVKERFRPKARVDSQIYKY